MTTAIATKETGDIEKVQQSIILTPSEVVENATIQAKLLMDIVEKKKCYVMVSGKKYLQVEAWETIGAFNGVHAETDYVLPIKNDKDEIIGYQSHVQLWKNGDIVGGSIMPCYFTENCCKGKKGDETHKAAMSASQTFATSKAYRMNFSYVAILAGYEPLPADEITSDMRGNRNTTQIDKGTEPIVDSDNPYASYLYKCPLDGDEWIDGQYGKSHKAQDGTYHRLSVVIREETQRLFGIFSGGEDAFYSEARGKGKAWFATDAFKEWMNNLNLDLPTWSKIEDTTKIEMLRTLKEQVDAIVKKPENPLVEEAKKLGAVEK